MPKLGPWLLMIAMLTTIIGCASHRAGDAVPPPPQIAAAFHSGPLKHGETPLVFKRMQVAELTVTSGRVIIADALMPFEQPLEVSLPPGRYPVILSRVTVPEDEDRNAYATLLVSRSPAVRWEWAAHAGGKPRPLDKHDQADAFVVSSWHAGFMDVDARAAFGKKLASMDSPLAAEHDAHDGSWNEHVFDDTPANVVTCFSGLGDGSYSVCVGRDRNGEISAVVIDFAILPDP